MRMVIPIRQFFYYFLLLIWGATLLYSLSQLLEYVEPSSFLYNAIFLLSIIGMELIAIFCFIGAYALVLECIDCVQ